MCESIRLDFDGEQVEARDGQTIMEVAHEHEIYIPHLCGHAELSTHGSCRVCMVKVNGQPVASCTRPAVDGDRVEVETGELRELRRAVVEMLFAEGNHFCPCCEKSGSCELQAIAYRLGIDSVRYPYQFPRREVDASHEQILLDHNRCILCGRCVRASRELDGKTIFEFVSRGRTKRVAVSSREGIGGTNLTVEDRAVEVCPVGAMLRKHKGFDVPLGERPFDHEPIDVPPEKVLGGEKP